MFLYLDEPAFPLKQDVFSHMLLLEPCWGAGTLHGEPTREKRAQRMWQLPG